MKILTIKSDCTRAYYGRNSFIETADFFMEFMTQKTLEITSRMSGKFKSNLNTIATVVRLPVVLYLRYFKLSITLPAL